MSATPEIVTRAEQPYAAIRTRVPMAELGAFAARIGEVFAWLGARGVAPAGAPFFKYNAIDMMRELEVEAGVPVAAAVDGDADVLSGVLPAGDPRPSLTWVTPTSSWRPPRRCWIGRPAWA